ncbi:MAG: alcohol dehydrogenase catalytic domain-containing protein [Anaerolineae bacterium]|nr:alcohol dehydrogenase catalytic domain-containing protein [Anaerolineae bacterium]
MKAAFLTGKKQYRVRDVPDPEAPDDGLVLRVEACGVCGSDLRRWREGPATGERSLPGFDGIIAGHEVAGTVVSAGHSVSPYRVGDRLAVAPDIHCGKCYYCQRGLFNLCDKLHYLGISPGYPGGFAELLVLTHEVLDLGIVHPIPHSLSTVHAAIAEPASSVLACHQKAKTSVKDTVVVIGAGPIGCLHVAVAKAHGARVMISEPSALRRDMATRFNPDAIINPVEEDFVHQVRELTAGLGADLIICANPISATQSQAVQAVRKGGRVVLFGGLPKANPMTTLDSNLIHYGEIEVVGAFSYHPTMHALALDALQRGVIPADLVITHQFPLNQIAEAFETAANGSGLKVVVVP